jgi:hypothetical protein
MDQLLFKEIYTFNNSTLDVSGSHHNIEIYKNWLNQNAFGEFICREGTVRFLGDVDSRIRVVSDLRNKFYNVYVGKDPSIQVTTDDNYAYTIQGNLEVASVRNLTLPLGIVLIYVGGDLNASGGTFTHDMGTYVLNKATGSAIVRTQGSRIAQMEINSSGGATYTAEDDLRVNRNFTVTAGTFDGNGKYIALGSNNHNITIFGTYKVGVGGTLAIGSAWWGTPSRVEVKPTGTIEVIGSAFQHG